MSRKRVPLNQNECTADFRIGVPFEQNLQLIHLSVAKQKNFLRIRCENYCEEQLKFENGIPVTTKKDRRFHGFGMKSIKSTAAKYGGSVTTDLKKNWFELRILIPLS